MQQYIPVGIAVAIPFGMTWFMNRFFRNYDAAFNQIMWELWENPNRDQSVSAQNNERIQKCQNYRDSSCFHIVFFDPPFDALKRFKGVSKEDYDKHCLQLANNRFEKLVNDIKQ